MASKVEAFEHLLGTIPDAKIADMAGVAESTVVKYRRGKGIAAHESAAEASEGADPPEDTDEEAGAPPAPTPSRRRRNPRAKDGDARIRVTQKFQYIGQHPKTHRPVTMTIIKNIYRGQMAEQVLWILQECGLKESDYVIHMDPEPERPKGPLGPGARASNTPGLR